MLTELAGHSLQGIRERQSMLNRNGPIQIHNFGQKHLTEQIPTNVENREIPQSLMQLFLENSSLLREERLHKLRRAHRRAQQLDAALFLLNPRILEA